MSNFVLFDYLCYLRMLDTEPCYSYLENVAFPNPFSIAVFHEADNDKENTT